MFEALIYLVTVHAQVSSISEGLLTRTLTALIEALAAEAFRCFKQVPRFGMGGMLRATLEIEFMHQTISKAYAKRPGDEGLQGSLDEVKRTLSETRRATGIEFLCFRATKAAGGEKGGSSAARREREKKENR